MGLCGIKGMPHTKELTDECDLIIALGCRFAPTFCMGNPKIFAKNATVVSINNDRNELKLNLKKINLKINSSLSEFLNSFYKFIKKKKIPSYKDWSKKCFNKKINSIIPNLQSKKIPIDLYKFMHELGNLAPKNSIMITDAGSNYYIGGQAWEFNKNQKEVSSTANAAMGLSLPLSIGAAVAEKKNVILSVTGDGSIAVSYTHLTLPTKRIV